MCLIKISLSRYLNLSDRLKNSNYYLFVIYPD